MWVISLNGKITSDEYKALSAAVKKVGGYYSRFAKTPDGKAIPGFVFKNKPTAREFDVFNEFFGYEDADKQLLKNEPASDTMKENPENGGVLNGEEETVHLRSDSSRRSDDDSGGTKKIARVGTKNARDPVGESSGASEEYAQRTYEEKQEHSVRHRGDGNSEIEFKPVEQADYTEEMISVAKRNAVINFDTVFTDGEIKLYNKDGRLVRIIEDGCYNKVNKAIYINSKSTEKFENINEHEKVHAVKRISPTAYDYLLRKITDCVDEVKFVSEINDYVSLYEKAWDVQEIAEEILANLSYEINSDNIPDFVKDAEGIRKAYKEYWGVAQYKIDTLEEKNTSEIEVKNEAVSKGEGSKPNGGKRYSLDTYKSTYSLEKEGKNDEREV